MYPSTQKRIGECSIDQKKNLRKCKCDMLQLKNSSFWKLPTRLPVHDPSEELATFPTQEFPCLGGSKFKATAGIFSPAGCLKNYSLKSLQCHMGASIQPKTCASTKPTFHTFHHQTQTPFRFIDIQQASHTWMVHAQEEFLNPASFVTDSTESPSR